jgi:DNA end-binding protein Ku
MPRKATKAKPKPAAKFRSSWRGLLSFGLVTFPVEAFNALDRQHGDIHFRQVHSECNRRIQYKKFCPVHGEISTDEISSAYEYKKGRYVEVEADELDALRTERDRGLTIDAFVAPETVDPLYFDGRMYYLVPSGEGAQEPYSVILDAMEREGRCGVGRIVFSGKDQIALLRPLEGILHMAMLNFQAEIRPPKTVARALPKPTRASRQVRLAQKLIEEWSDDDFDFSKYEDTYREQVEELIEAKVRGRDIVPPAEQEPADVLNLMDALKRSIGVQNKRNGKSKKARRSA